MQDLKHLTADPTLNLSTAVRKTVKKWHNQTMLWSELLDRLSKPTRTSESKQEYAKATKAQRDEIKDVGGFVGGFLKGGRRKADAVQSRSLVTLDADFPSDTFWQDVQAKLDCTLAIYSTHSHTRQNPRVRLLIPLASPVTPEQYVPLARKIAEKIGMDNFDDTTYQPERLMYYPSYSFDGDYTFDYQDGMALEPQTILDQYEDWRDASFWPTSTRESSVYARQAKRAGDPLKKPGVVGAFCRTYSITQAIETFLSEIYAPTKHDDRYTYIPGTTSGGLVLYDDKFAYSHHGTDPTGDMLTNAFDLVRLHLYGDQDDKVKPDTKVTNRPSYKAMVALATQDSAVRVDLDKMALGQAQADFDDPDGATTDPESFDAHSEAWLEYSESGARTVNAFSLAEVLLKQVPMYYDGTEFLRYDATQGIWLDDAEAFCKGLLTKKYLLKLTKINVIKEVISAAQGLLTTTKVFRDGAVDKLVLKNGVYDLKTDTFDQAFDPKLHARVKHPIAYDAKATCPTFDGYLDYLVGVDSKAFVYEWLGYLFYRGYPLQKFLFLQGKAGTGKSTLIRIMQALVGPKASSNVTLKDLADSPFAAKDLYQKTANFDADTKDIYLDDAAFIKTLTGGDLIRADVKFREPIAFRNTAKLTFSMNALPAMRDIGGSVKRRAILLKIDTKITQAVKDRYPLDTIMRELPGIFNKAMAGLRHILKAKSFSLSDQTQASLEAWALDNDPVRRFINDFCQVKPGLKVEQDKLYLEYASACTDSGEKALGRNRFYQNLDTLGFQKTRIRINGNRTYLRSGIGLNVSDFD